MPKDLKDISLPEVVEQINWQLLDELFHDKIGDLLNEEYKDNLSKLIIMM